MKETAKDMSGGEFKGKSVDEAIFNGLNALGCSLDEVHIEVVHEGGRGLFGIGKNAVVRMTVKEEDEIGPESHEAEEVEETSLPVPEKPVRERSGKKASETVAEEKGTRESSVRSGTAAEAAPAKEKSASEDRVIETVEDTGPATAFLNGLFEKMGVDAVCSKLATSDDSNLRLRIAGKDTAVLIGRRGDTLDALQYLTGLVVNRGHSDYIRVMLDAENYREKREKTLEKLARRLAANVARSGRTVRLEPMNPYERRILHATLQSDPKVETYSEGTDPYRRVVIRKKRSGKAADRRKPE